MSLYEQLSNISTFKQLNPTDITVTPFNAYKSWTIYQGKLPTGYFAYSSSYNSSMVTTIRSSKTIPTLLLNVTRSLNNIRHQSLEHLFYRKNDSYHVYGTQDINNTKKFLYVSASILSIPQDNTGDGIKPKSFTFISGSVILNDDRFGNIYDTTLDTSRYISNTMFYEGFNEYYNLRNITTDPSQNRYYTGSVNAVTFVPGVSSTSPVSKNMGHCALFNGTGSIIIKDTEINGVYNKNTDYSISLFVMGDTSIWTKPRTILCKTGVSVPYHITVEPDSKLGFYIHTANRNPYDSYVDTMKTTNIFVTSSTAVTGSYRHVVCQKSGSYLQIYVNNVLEANKQFTELTDSNSPLNFGYELTNTPSNLYIGGWPTTNSTDYNYIGRIDEIRIYDKALTSTQCSYLSDLHVTGSMLQTNKVGNLFPKQGLAIISSPNFRYNDIIKTRYTASFKSTITKHELSAFVKVKSNEFNNSINSTLTDYTGYRYNTELINSDNFTPYITTIGFYNSDGVLLMIGKLSQPVKKRSDVDLNFFVKLDLDNSI